MARDLKLVQRGVNVQANDLAVPAGTPLRAQNIDYQRDGVAARRAGFERFDQGLPWEPIDPLQPMIGGATELSSPDWDDVTFGDNPDTRGIYELFARDRSFAIHGGFVFTYDENAGEWMTVPVAMSHRFNFFGNFDVGDTEMRAAGVGRAVELCPGGTENYSPLSLQTGLNTLRGCIGNRANEAAIQTATTQQRFGAIADMASLLKSSIGDAQAIAASDSSANVIWNLTNLGSGEIMAGSLTASGHADGTGPAATFLGPSWLTVDRSHADRFYVADNSNMIRKVTSAGVVTTLCGSITAGDADGFGTAALFRSISGMAIDPSGGYLYVTESAGHRVRKVNVTTGEVVLLAGSASAVAGYADDTGAAALFDTPIGCEVVSDGVSSYLYVGDTRNWRVRRVDTTTGDVTSYAGTGTPGVTYTEEQDGITGGASPVILRSKIRGKYRPIGSQSWFLVLECDDLPVSTTSMDVSLLRVTTASEEARVYHIVRCPSGYPDGATGPNKLDTVGPNVFGLAQTRGVDCGNGAAFATSDRPHMIDAWTRNDDADPMPRLRPLGIYGSEAPIVSAVAGTTFAQSMTVAYRVVTGMNLPDGRIAFSPPSERIILAGSATATWAGSITAYPPPGLTYDGQAFLQLYRTRASSIAVDPGDQMFLCYEAPLAYGAGLSIADILPDDLLGAELYTNTTEDGVAATALAPPMFATEIAAFNNRAVASNYVRQALLRIKVLGVSTLVASTDTITITQTPTNAMNPRSEGLLFRSTLTLKAIAGTTNPAANQFQIASGGTAAQNAVQTARNIVSCINRSPDAMLFTAQYDESEPGTILVTSLWPGTSKGDLGMCESAFDGTVSPTTVQSALSFSTTRAAAFQAAQQAVSTRTQNALAYSEQGAYDSFPIGNEERIGHGAEGTVRLLPISDVLLAVKDDSVWSMDAGFNPQIYDKALSCSLPDSFAPVNNQWIGLFTRGFVSLGSSQAVAIGRPIDRDASGQYGNFRDGATTDQAQAAAIDLSGNYLCVFNRRAYVYNVVSQCWSEWSIDLVSVAGDVSGAFEPTAAGAYLDSLLITQNGARAMLHQHRAQRDATDWYKDYADPAYSFGTATLAADLITMTTTYAATSNAGELPPIVVEPPAGAVASAGNDAAAFRWVFAVTQGGTTANVPGVIAVADPSDPASAITITLAQALTGITAGSVTVIGYPPIICRVQYAPFAATGSNASFGDALATIERCQPGYMVARFFGRQDYGDATEQPIGWYGDSYGVSRAKLMASITVADYGVGSLIAYEEVMRFPTPRERATGQTLGVELWEGMAWQPLAIKAVTLDKGDKDNPKVTT